jgi:hypothetical protein
MFMVVVRIFPSAKQCMQQHKQAYTIIRTYRFSEGNSGLQECHTHMGQPFRVADVMAMRTIHQDHVHVDEGGVLLVKQLHPEEARVRLVESHGVLVILDEWNDNHLHNKHGWIDGWIDGWLDGGMDGCADGWLGIGMDGLVV